MTEVLKSGNRLSDALQDGGSAIATGAIVLGGVRLTAEGAPQPDQLADYVLIGGVTAGIIGTVAIIAGKVIERRVNSHNSTNSEG